MCQPTPAVLKATFLKEKMSHRYRREGFSWTKDWQHQDPLGVRNRHTENIPEQTERNTISVQDFRNAIQHKGMKWTVIDGHVYDLKNLIGNHPGGDFLDEFVGTDATLYFYIKHLKSRGAWRRLRACWKGYLDEPQGVAHDLDRKLIELVEELGQEGKLTFPLRDIVIQCIICVSLYVAQFVLAVMAIGPSDTYHCCSDNGSMLLATASLLCGTLAFMLTGYFLHDCGHQSVFDTKEGNSMMTFLGGLVMGVAATETLAEHDMHHGYPNVLSRDGTLNTGIIVWHRDQVKGELPEDYSDWAPKLWYGFVLWMYSPVEVYRIAKIGIEKSWRSIVGYVIRYAFAFGAPYLFGSTWLVGVVYLASFLLSGFTVALISTFNHLAEPKENVAYFRERTREGRSFVEHQLGKSCSFTRGAFEAGLVPLSGEEWEPPAGLFCGRIRLFLHRCVSWLTGHFNYHQEHHMVPFMPRQHLREISWRLRRVVETSTPTKVTTEEDEGLLKVRGFMESFFLVYDAVCYPFGPNSRIGASSVLKEGA